MTALTNTVPQGTVIDVSPRLLAHGLLAPLRPSTKRPWLRSLINEASSDPAVVAAWQQTKPGCSWGLRIESDSLIVLDLERPGKGSPAGGIRMIDWVECENGKRLPDGPVATTESGGEHRYFLLPEQYRGQFKNWTSALPGVDVRVKGGLVVIPPDTNRQWIESPDDLDIPELPAWFCDLLLADRRVSNANRAESGSDVGTRRRAQSADAANDILRAHIPARQWFTLRCSPGFWQLWCRNRLMRDTSNSGYEFSIARVGYRCGLSTEQVAALVSAWWSRHNIHGNYDRLTKRIMPVALETVREYVESFQAEREAKQAGKTVNRILGLLRTLTSAAPSEIASNLDMPTNTVVKALGRMTCKGQLIHAAAGEYQIPQACIHTQNVTVEKCNGDNIASAVRGTMDTGHDSQQAGRSPAFARQITPRRLKHEAHRPYSHTPIFGARSISRPCHRRFLRSEGRPHSTLADWLVASRLRARNRRSAVVRDSILLLPRVSCWPIYRGPPHCWPVSGLPNRPATYLVLCAHNNHALSI
jgi:hypothetical protein